MEQHNVGEKQKEFLKNLSPAEQEATRLKFELHKLCSTTKQTRDISSTPHFDWEHHQEISTLGELIRMAEKKEDFIELEHCEQELKRLKKDIKICERLVKEEARSKQKKSGLARVTSFPSLLKRKFSRGDLKNRLKDKEKRPGVDLDTAMINLEEEIHER